MLEQPGGHCQGGRWRCGDGFSNLCNKQIKTLSSPNEEKVGTYLGGVFLKSKVSQSADSLYAFHFAVTVVFGTLHHAKASSVVKTLKWLHNFKAVQ